MIKRAIGKEQIAGCGQNGDKTSPEDASIAITYRLYIATQTHNMPLNLKHIIQTHQLHLKTPTIQ
jgi:hypothetical protein